MSSTLLELVQQVVGELSSDIATPTSIVGNQDQTVIQLFRLANRVGVDLVREYEWRRLVTEYSFATVNGTAEYDLPADFDRMCVDTHYDRTNDWKNRGPVSSQEWQWLNTGLSTVTQLRWRLYLNKIKFYSTPGDAYTMAFEYVSRYWVVATGGSDATKERFTMDNDTCVFPDDLMALGLKFQWLKAKGLDWEAAYLEFDRARSTCKAQDVPDGKKSLSPQATPILLDSRSMPEGNWTL